MSIKITWLGHSTFELVIDGHSVLLDPYLVGNPVATAKPEDLNPEIIFVSHGHGDHCQDVLPIAQRTGCKVVANAEIAGYYGRQGVANAHGQNSGGSFNHGFVRAKFTFADHSSTLPDGSSGGHPNGIILTANDSGLKLYFAGDTALFSDMKLIGDHGIDAAILPIGDNFTMGVDDSVLATQFIRPRYVLPMHYNTFPPIRQDAAEWARRIQAETSASPVVLDVGGSFTVEKA